MPRNLLIIITLLLGAPNTLAHEDDMGDIDPDVRVENSNFVIYFRNSVLGEKGGSVVNKIFKSILDKEGKIIVDRQQIVARPPVRPPHVDPKIGKSVDELMDLALLGTEKDRKKGEGTIYSTFTEDGHEREIIGSKGQLAQINAKGFVAGAIVLAVSPKIPNEERMSRPLEFHSYDPDTTQRIHSARIGIPERIYSFPPVSNIVAHDSHAYMASMIQSKEGNFLHLSRFNPRTGDVVNKRVSLGAGNSSPSIEVIGDKMLIAFHRPQFFHEEGKPKLEAKIIHQDVNLSEFFKVAK